MADLPNVRVSVISTFNYLKKNLKQLTCKSETNNTLY